jgi:hypothetical protein
LVRILLEPALRIGDADEAEQLDRASLGLCVAHAQMNLERLHELQSDCQDRIERSHRLLEDHRDVAAADFAHLLIIELKQVAAVEQNAALRHAAGKPRQ